MIYIVYFQHPDLKKERKKKKKKRRSTDWQPQYSGQKGQTNLLFFRPDNIWNIIDRKLTPVITKWKLLHEHVFEKSKSLKEENILFCNVYAWVSLSDHYFMKACKWTCFYIEQDILQKGKNFNIYDVIK